MKYWIVVVSKDHIARGVEGGFIQANHGKQAPLKREEDFRLLYGNMVGDRD